MFCLRRCLAVLMTVALALYGAAATTLAHAHAYSGFHGVHIVTDDHSGREADHHRDSVAADATRSAADPNAPAPEHHETGFHSHAAPQFSPAEASSVVEVVLASRQTFFLSRDRSPSNARAELPFKPPRIL